MGILAVNNTEIEIQVKINEQIFNNLYEFLQKEAKFIKTICQEDDYYTPVHRNFVEPQFPFEWLRIGRRGERNIVTYKHWHPENGEVHTHCDEFETEISDKEQLENIFKVLDMKKLVTVKKTRNSFIYNEEFEVSLDIVDELGYYIEIEVLKDFGSIEEGIRRLNQFADKFGIDLKDRNHRGYPMILLEKKGLIKAN